MCNFRAEKLKNICSHITEMYQTNFPIIFRSIPIQKCTRHVCLCVLEKSLSRHRFGHDTAKWRRFSEKWRLRSLNCIWAALPGAKPWKGLRPNKATHYMTRRAFLALRVIQRQRKSSFNMLVKKWEELITKMKISQNLWIRFTPDQFFRMHEAKTYPGM